MLFNSISFFILLIFTFFVYWFVLKKSIKLQNVFLLVISYFFYGAWDWRFLFLLFFSSILDFTIGIALSNSTKRKKILLGISLFSNLGLLVYFKYMNFFISSFTELMNTLNISTNTSSLNIILPVGISFYTFQTLSYTIDVYKGKIKASRDPISFLAFVSFFPQLVAGPIERATHLLPQFLKKRTFNYHLAVLGCRQIIWGLFKKVVIADNCAEYANLIFNNYQEYNGIILFIGAVFFAFQIYGDFSGYSDIAIGVSRLFGFSLMQNFAFPYFSRDISEFWRRWHISLSTWFRDYIYIPLGGSRVSKIKLIRNTFVIFMVSGLWHGANWTFLVWGMLHTLFILPIIIFKQNRKNLTIVAENSLLPSLKDFIKICFTFSLVTFAWIFFRADSIQQALEICCKIPLSVSYIMNYHETFNFILCNVKSSILIILLLFIIIEWIGRKGEFALEKMFLHKKSFLNLFIYSILLLLVIQLSGKEQNFIYFQF